MRKVKGVYNLEVMAVPGGLLFLVGNTLGASRALQFVPCLDHEATAWIEKNTMESA